MRFDVLEPPRTYVKNSIHLALPNNMLFGVVQAHRTSSNLLKKHVIRESEVYRVFHISSG